MLKLIFWILLILIAYTYFGYAVLLLLLNAFKRLQGKHRNACPLPLPLPEVTLLIAAYNEKDTVGVKVKNTREIKYPGDKLKVIWITDGSDDGTPELLSQYSEIKVFHTPERKGKTAALNRALKVIDTPFVIFSDANTMLDPDAINQLIAPFGDERVGCVAGEKRISKNIYEVAAGAGEGAYWQYESFLKRLESDFLTVLAAAGELYAIRTKLYQPVDPDIIIDDFVISLNIARQGYRIKYQPDAFAMENSSANIREELKRKIRIASGAMQTMFRYPSLFNLFKYGFLSFEFISHKVLRWLLVPIAIPLILVLSVALCIQTQWQEPVYIIILLMQALFYFFVLLGIIFERRATRWRIVFLPFYLVIINYAQYAGILKFLRGKHNVVWEKAKRAT